MLERRLEDAMSAFGNAVFVSFARLDARGLEAVVIDDSLEALRQSSAALLLGLVGGGGHVVLPYDVWHAPKLPERALHTGEERLERLAERDLHVARGVEILAIG